MSPDLHHLSGAYAVDALATDERTEFEQHLAVCPACRAEVAELTDAAHALGALSDATPPASLRAGVLSGIARVRPLPPLVDDVAEGAVPFGSPVLPDPATTPVAGEAAATVQGARVIPLFRRTTTWIAAAAAASVLAVGGVVWSPWSDDRPVLTAVQQVEQAQDVATVTSHKGPTTATLAYSRDLDRSALTVAGMPAAPEGKVYQLWYIGVGGARSAGFLAAGDGGQGEAVLDGTLAGARQVGVTIEPAGGSPTPTGDPVMVMALA